MSHTISTTQSPNISSVISSVISKIVSRYTLIFLGLMLAISPSYSQYTSQEESDPKAITLLEKIKNDYIKASGHKITFTLDMAFPGRGLESQSGDLIQSGEKFVLDMADRKIISDNETAWMYIKEMNEVQISDVDFEATTDFMSPSDIFNLYQSKDYVFAITEYGKEEGQAVTKIECKPLSDDSEYSKLRLTVVDNGHRVKRLKIFSKDGSRFTMHIKEHDSKYKTDADTFKFIESDYEGVMIEDLRFKD